MSDLYISKYSRADAIADGLLYDISTYTERVGIVYPVAVTKAVWGNLEHHDEDENPMSRLAQFILVLRSEMIKGGQKDSINFSLTFGQLYHFIAAVLPGDNFEPVVTVTMKGED